MKILSQLSKSLNKQCTIRQNQDFKSYIQNFQVSSYLAFNKLFTDKYLSIIRIIVLIIKSEKKKNINKQGKPQGQYIFILFPLKINLLQFHQNSSQQNLLGLLILNYQQKFLTSLRISQYKRKGQNHLITFDDMINKLERKDQNLESTKKSSLIELRLLSYYISLFGNNIKLNFEIHSQSRVNDQKTSILVIYQLDCLNENLYIIIRMQSLAIRAAMLQLMHKNGNFSEYFYKKFALPFFLHLNINTYDFQYVAELIKNIKGTQVENYKQLQFDLRWNKIYLNDSLQYIA
ncbi:unnamed protein product (macronuclear) [Paramecium tetraurelia]|uniref:Transmembrane protein n=1 Tax=Paramecium tetraurelia TaxID=5888 RepID=A0C279_PARTE|nr:uncharacterized protein GSPATT00034373001 [Paramecium tetraurelia]CAK64896.1 unnamed protein product [Paramecium tetraurelia]|eukprot:XP_001432293.1 hypothetical protein (macronuclear) [Paramecium tetraurelia strain d4-2]